MAQRINYTPAITETALEELKTLVEDAAFPAQAQARLAVFAEHKSRALNERAAALVLGDLIRQGWVITANGDGIWISTVGGVAGQGERAEEAKLRVKKTLQAFRSLQLAEPGVRKFIKKMETPRLYRGERVSVLDLVDDGEALSFALSDIARLPPSRLGEEINGLICPILEIATPDAICEHTGLSLYDVWRYFRHTWSLEYRTTPGRSLAFLIRNAARPKAPIMGIASIANAALQLKVRDDWIGWSTSAIVSSLTDEPARWPHLRTAMIKAVATAKSGVRSDDLLEGTEGLTSPEIEERLTMLAGAAREERNRRLRAREREDEGERAPLKGLPRDEDGEIDWREASESPLFRRKRAETLAALLFAERILDELPRHASALNAKDRDTRRAISIASREIRKVGLSSRLLDVNVCGAVSPYRDLLVGKLVALAMASDEVSAAYRRRYRGHVSEIASQVAGAPISRDSEICLLTTTSLYGAVSSQYNRLKIQVETDTGEALIRWRDLGLTEGWGTTHFSEKTVEALRAVAIKKSGGRNVNNVFGEGQSPRMRQVREGLAALGLQEDVLLKHRHARRVYGLELSDDGRDALRLNRRVKPCRPTFEEIARAWMKRWLYRRINDERIRARVSAEGPESVRDSLVPTVPQLSLFMLEAAAVTPRRPNIEWNSVMSTQSNPALIKSLYRAHGACAEHHDPEVVERLHIATPVDDFIKRLAARRILFVTGNPGDGKTHILRRLETELERAKVDVHLDANELPSEELRALVNKAARSRTRGLALAINEGILVQLLRDAEGERWVEPARAQLLRPFVYGEDDESVEGEPVLVLDLNLRNNLAPEIIEAALMRQISVAAPCEVCPGAKGCSLRANATRLEREPRAVERLARLLEAVARVGVHATMREIQGLLAFILAGEERCEYEIDAVRPYWTSAFVGGEGALFDALRRFDPARVTLPLLDDKLWRRADRPEDWLAPWPGQIIGGESLEDHLEAFAETKRRALFEHVEGEGLIRSSSQIDEELERLLRGDARALREIIRLLNRFYDRDEDVDKHLWLWMTHRYDAAAPRFAAAAASVPRAELIVLRPRLRSPLSEAFPDYRPDHALLCTKRLGPSVSLRIDRSLVEALVAAERGLPSSFRRGEPEARISAFINKLAKDFGDPSREEQVDVWLVDRDTGKNIGVSVDVPNRRFVGN